MANIYKALLCLVFLSAGTGYARAQENPSLPDTTQTNWIDYNDSIGNIDPGEYYILFREVGTGCVSDTASFDIQLLEQPAAPVALAQSFCAGSVVADLVAEYPDSTQLLWYASADSNTVLSDSIELESGIYYAAALSPEGCESEKVAVQVTVNPLLTPELSIYTEDTLICEGESASFTAELSPSEINVSEYQWFVNNQEAGSNNATFTSSDLNNDDEVHCRVIVHGDCVSDTTDFSNVISIKVIPQITFAVTDSTSYGDTSGTVVLSGLETGKNYAYQLDSNDWQSYANNISGLEEGGHEIKVREEGIGCESDPVGFTINLIDSITFDLDVLADVTILGGNDGSVRLSNVAGGVGSGYTVQLNDNPAVSITDSLTIDTLSAGTYTMQVFDEADNASALQTFEIGQPSTFTFDAHVAQHETTAGAADGVIVIDSIYAGQGLTFTANIGDVWFTVAQGDSLSSLPAGQISLVLRTGTIYSDTLTLTIDAGCAPINFSVNELTACGDTTGTLLLAGLDTSTVYEYRLFGENVVDEDKSFIMEFDIPYDGYDLTIPLYDTNGYDFFIDWGDGDASSQITTWNSSNLKHTYETSGKYQVKITGDCPRIYFYEAANKDDLVRIVQWGDVGFTSLGKAFHRCSNLYELPEDPITGAENVSDFSGCFTSNSLTNIPEGLFDNCPNATDFTVCFYGNSLTTLPDGLFSNCHNAEIFYACFYQNSLESIPDGLFSNCSKVTDYSWCFSYNALDSLPLGLFADSPDVSTFYCTFYGNALLELPADLFSYSPDVTTFYFCFGYNPLIEIPGSLFDNCQDATTFSYCFYRNNDLTGFAPELWLRYPEPGGTGCYCAAVGLDNYYEIPADWKSTGFTVDSASPLLANMQDEDEDGSLTSSETQGDSIIMELTAEDVDALLAVKENQFKTYSNPLSKSTSLLSDGEVTGTGWKECTDIIKALNPGSYKILVREKGTLCVSDTVSFNIVLKEQPDQPISQGNQIICEGEPVPALSVSVGENQIADWYNAADELVANGTTSYYPTMAGTYYVKARNTVSGCQSVGKTAVSLSILPLLTITDYTTTDVTYFGANNGQLTINSLTGGSGQTVQLILDGNLVADDFTAPLTIDTLCTGNHFVFASEEAGCPSDTILFTIEQPSTFTFDAHVAQHETTAGASDGVIVIDSIYASQFLTFEYSIDDGETWDSIAQGGQITGLAQGVVSIQLRNDTVYSDVQSFTICQPLVFTVEDQFFCETATVGELEAEVEEGNQLRWYATAESDTVLASNTELESGTYYAIVISSEGCESERIAVEIIVNPLLEMAVDAPEQLCKNTIDTISATVSGGSGNYAYLWEGINVDTELLFVPRTNERSTATIMTHHIPSGIYNYRLTVSDSVTNCSVSETFSIEVLYDFNMNFKTFTSNVAEGDTSVVYELYAMEGATYEWSVDGGEIVSGKGTSQIKVNWTQPGDYEVRASMGLGNCTQEYSRGVTVYSLPTITLGENPSVCQGTGIAELSYSSKTQYPTQYSIEFNELALQAGFNNIVNEALPVSPFSIPLPSSIAPGVYQGKLSVTAHYPTRHSIPVDFEIILSGLPTVTVATEQSFCGITTVSELVAEVEVGNQLRWYTAESDTVLAANTELESGIYYATAVSSEGCESEKVAVQVTVNPLLTPELSIYTEDTLICEGESVSFTAELSPSEINISEYQWFVNNQEAGSNNATFTSSDLNNDDEVHCRVIVHGDCLADTIALSNAISIKVIPQITFAVSDSTSYGDTSGTVVLSGLETGKSYDYQLDGNNWQRYANNISGLEEGGHEIKVREEGIGCESDTVGFTINLINRVLLHYEEPIDVSVYGGNDGTITITSITGGEEGTYMLQFNGGDTFIFSDTLTIDTLAAGTYTLQAFDNSGNAGALEYITISQPETYNFTISLLNNVSCFDGNDAKVEVLDIISGYESTYQYRLNYGDWQELATDLFIDSLKARDYIIELMDEHNTISNEVLLTVHQPDIISFDASVTHGESIPGYNQGEVAISNLSGGTGAKQFSLNDTALYNGNVDFIDGLSVGSYTLVAFDENNCTSAPYNFEIVEDTLLSVIVEKIPPVECNGVASIHLDFVGVNGAQLKYSYRLDDDTEWNSLSDDYIITGITPDTLHTIFVKDHKGYEFDSVCFMVEAYYPVSYSLNTSFENCSELGEIIVSDLSGGDGNYEYLIVSEKQSLQGRVDIMDETYSWVKIGEQYWLSNNLHYEDKSQGVLSYNRDDSLANVYGYLYDWDAAERVAALIEGWHLPNYDEWYELIQYAGGEDVAGAALKGTGNWNQSGFDALNTYLFNALPAGQSLKSNLYEKIYESTFFWTATKSDDDKTALAWVFSAYSDECISNYGETTYGRSVRLIKDDDTSLDYSGKWKPLNESGRIDSLESGQYTVVIRDGQGCKAVEQSIYLKTTPQLEIALSVKKDVTCYNGSNGKIVVDSIFGGTGSNLQYMLAGYENQWIDYAGDSIVYNNLVAGDYSFVVRDSVGCEIQMYLPVREPAELAISYSYINQYSYKDANNGVVKIDSVEGGSGNYQLLLFDENNNQQVYSYYSGILLENLQPGEYELFVSDSSECLSDSYLLEIYQVDSIRFELIDITNYCDRTGTLKIENCSGGRGDSILYSTDLVNWEIMNADSTINGLATGDYTVWLKDGYDNLSAGHDAEIYIADSVQFNVENISVLCDGAGTIELSDIRGGYGGYRYYLGDGTGKENPDTWVAISSDTVKKTEIENGNYELIVADQHYCRSITETITINQNPQIEAIIENQTPTVYYGSNYTQVVVRSVTGGAGGHYWYRLHENDDWLDFETAIVLNNLDYGNYLFTAKDSSGCTTQPYAFTVSLNAELIIEASVTEHVKCFSAESGIIRIDTIAGGSESGYKFSFNGGELIPYSVATRIISELGAGDYSIIAFDSFNNQSTPVVLTVTSPKELIAAVSPIDSVTCYGDEDGMAVVDSIVGGTLPYNCYLDGELWLSGYNNNTPIDSLSAGQHVFKVVDSNGCETDTVFNIEDPDMFTLDAEKYADASCFGSNDGSIEIISTTGGNGVNAYLLDANEYLVSEMDSNYITSLYGGTYELKAKDNKGCLSNSLEISIGEPDFISFELNFTRPLCPGSSDATLAIVNASGGSGHYTVFVNDVDKGGCTEATDTTIRNLSAGDYVVRLEDANGCQGSAVDMGCYESVPTVPTNVSIKNQVIDDAGCYVATQTIVVADDGNEVRFQNASNTNLIAGQSIRFLPGTVIEPEAYVHAWITDDGTFLSNDHTITIEDIDPIEVETLVVDETCAGDNNGSIQIISITGGTPTDGEYSYSLNSGVPFQYIGGQANHEYNGLSPDNYTLTVIDGNSCSAYFEYPVEDGNSIDLTLSGATDVTCYDSDNGEVDIEISGDASKFFYKINQNDSIEYSAPGVNVNTLSEGNHIITAIDEDGCTASDNITIDVSYLVEFDANATKKASCASDAANGELEIINLNGGDNYLYRIDNSEWIGISGDSVVVEGITSGEHNVWVKNESGCMAVPKDVNIERHEALDVEVIVSDVKCFGGSTGIITIAHIGRKYRDGYINTQYKYSIQFNDEGQVEWHDFDFENNENERFRIGGLSRGNYHLKVYDRDGCGKFDTIIHISEPEKLEIHSIVSLPNCDGIPGSSLMSKMKIDSVTGGVGSYSYHFNVVEYDYNGYDYNINGVLYNMNGDTYSDFDSICNILAFVTDDNLCKSNLFSYKVEKTEVLRFVHNALPSRCEDGKGSDVITSISGGSLSGFMYSLDGGAEYKPFNSDSLPYRIYNIPQGINTISLKDDANCVSETESFEIIPGEGFQCQYYTHLPNRCSGDSASFTLFSVAGDTSSNVYQLRIDSYLDDASTIETGEYTDVVFPLDTIFKEKGTYKVYVRDSVCEELVESIVVPEMYEGYAFEEIEINHPACNGQYGSAVINSISVDAADISDFYYQIDGDPWVYNANVDSLILDSLSSGKRKIRFMDTITVNDETFACISQKFDIEINYIEKLYANFAIDSLDCSTTDTHLSFAGARGGNANDSLDYTYSINENGGNISLYDDIQYQDSILLAPGNYNLYIEDSLGCKSSDYEFEINQKEELTFSIDVENPLCANEYGKILISDISGGSGFGYGYTLNNESFIKNTTAFSIDSLVTDTFNISIFDGRGCLVDTNNLYIQIPDVVDFALGDVFDAQTDYPGKVVIDTIMGGNGAYSYQIASAYDKFTSDFNDYSLGDSIDISGDGKYYIQFADSNDCVSRIDSFEIHKVDKLEVFYLKYIAGCIGPGQSVTVGALGNSITHQFAVDTNYNQLYAHGDNIPFSALMSANKLNILTATDTIDVSLNVLPVIDSIRNKGDDFNTCMYSFFSNNGGARDHILYRANDTAKRVFIDTLALTAANSVSEITFTDMVNHYHISGQLEFNSYHAPEFEVNQIDALRYGEEGGIVFTSLSGGDSLFYQCKIDNGKWEDVSTNDTIYVSAVPHLVTIRDAANCQSQPTLVEVTSPPQLAVNLTIQNEISCPGESDATIVAHASGGITPGDYEFSWMEIANETSDDISGSDSILQVGAGTYVVTVECSDEVVSDTIKVLPCEPIVLFDSIITNVTYNGGSNGVAELIISGGVAPYYIEQSLNGSSSGEGWTTNNIFSGLSANVYTASVKDANSCEVVVDFTVSEPEVLSFSADMYSPSTYNGNDGRIEIYVSGGVGPYRVELKNSDGYEYHQSAHNDSCSFVGYNSLTVREYYVGIIDANGVCVSDTVLLENPSVLQVSNINWVEPVCAGDYSGEISFIVSGGTPFGTYRQPYEYVWTKQNGDIYDTLDINQPYATELGVGDYEIEISDSMDMRTSVSFQLKKTNPLYLNILETRDISCKGSNSGYIKLDYGGGNEPKVYLNDTVLYSTELTNLSAGTFNFVISDQSCSLSKTVVIEGPAAELTMDVSSTDPVSAGGNEGIISVTDISGGREGKMLILSTVDEFGATSIKQTIADVSESYEFSGLYSGDYLVQLFDSVSNNEPTNVSCELAKYVTLYRVDELDVEIVAVQELGCNNSSAIYNVIPHGGNPGDNGYAVSCNKSNGGGNSIETIEVENNVFQIEISKKGNYSVVVSDGALNWSGDIIVEQYELNVIVTKKNVSCFGESDGYIELSVTGGTLPYSYRWNDDNGVSAAVRQDLASGTYQVTINDSGGCTEEISDIIIEAPDEELTINIDNIQSTLPTGNESNDGSIQLIDVAISGGWGNYSYAWYNQWGDFIGDTRDIQNLYAGYYTLYVSNSNNSEECSDSVVVYLTANDYGVAIMSAKDPDCSYSRNGVLRAYITGGVPLDSDLNNMSYTWYKRDNNDWVVLPGNNSTLQSVSKGEYMVEADFGTGDTVTAEYTVQPLSEWSLVLDVKQARCNGEKGRLKLVFDGEPGEDYMAEWSTGSVGDSIINLSQGEYSVLVTDSNGCSASASAFVEQRGTLAMDSVVESISCLNDSGSINMNVFGGSGDYKYNWHSVGEGTTPLGTDGTDLGGLQTGLQPGIYMVRVTDNTYDGCVLETSFDLNLPAEKLEWWNGIPDSVYVCFEDRAIIPEVEFNTDGVSYSWKNTSGLVLSNDPFYELTKGTYKLSVTYYDSCVWEKEIVVDKSSFEIAPEFLLPTYVYLDQEFYIVNTTDYTTDDINGIDEVIWNWPDDNSLELFEESDFYLGFKAKQAGEHTVSLYISNGDCSRNFTKTIIVSDESMPELKSLNVAWPIITSLKVTPNPVVIPNSFTIEVVVSGEVDFNLRLYDYINAGEVESDSYSEEHTNNWNKIENEDKSVKYTKTFENNLSGGKVYILTVTTPYETKSFKIESAN